MSEILLRFTENERSDKAFLFSPILCPRLVICYLPEANIHVHVYINSYKVLYKTIDESDASVIYNKWLEQQRLSFTQKLHHWGIICPCPKANMSVLNHEKYCRYEVWDVSNFLWFEKSLQNQRWKGPRLSSSYKNLYHPEPLLPFHRCHVAMQKVKVILQNIWANFQSKRIFLFWSKFILLGLSALLPKQYCMNLINPENSE